jgi:hypothetical protein
MTTWLYQLSQDTALKHPPSQYRLDVWENVTWNWPVGDVRDGADPPPKPGEIVVFYYSGPGPDGGFYGWAVVLRWQEEDRGGRRLSFRPVAPSDSLKMCPWNDYAAGSIADRIRGDNKRLTLYRVPGEFEYELRRGILSWPESASLLAKRDGQTTV